MHSAIDTVGEMASDKFQRFIDQFGHDAVTEMLPRVLVKAKQQKITTDNLVIIAVMSGPVGLFAAATRETWKKVLNDAFNGRIPEQMLQDTDKVIHGVAADEVPVAFVGMLDERLLIQLDAMPKDFADSTPAFDPNVN